MYVLHTAVIPACVLATFLYTGNVAKLQHQLVVLGCRD